MSKLRNIVISSENCHCLNDVSKILESRSLTKCFKLSNCIIEEFFVMITDRSAWIQSNRKVIWSHLFSLVNYFFYYLPMKSIIDRRSFCEFISVDNWWTYFLRIVWRKLFVNKFTETPKKFGWVKSIKLVLESELFICNFL